MTTIFNSTQPISVRDTYTEFNQVDFEKTISDYSNEDLFLIVV